MLKRMLAITLAAVFAIMPMTASAVTWGEVVSGLKAGSGSYYNEDEDVYADYDDENELVNVYGSGTIAGDGEGNVILITPDTVSGAWEYYFNGVKLSADQIKIETNDQPRFRIGFGEDTVVDGDVVSEAKTEYSYIHVSNRGTINGDMIAAASGKESDVFQLNTGTVTGDMTATASGEGAYVYNFNEGTTGDMTVTLTGGMTDEGYGAGGGNGNLGTAGNMTVTASGEGASGDNNNVGTAGNITIEVSGEGAYGGNDNSGIADSMTLAASGKASETSQRNAGEVTGDMNAIASGEGSYINNYVYGGAVGGSLNAVANAEDALVWNNEFAPEGVELDADVSNVTASASNGGTVVNEYYGELDSMTAIVGEGGTVIAGWLGGEEDPETGEWIHKPETDPEYVNAKNVTIVIEAGGADTYTAEQINAMIEATGMTPDQTVYYTVNAEGERTAEYSVGADGSLTFVRQLIEETASDDEMTDEQRAWIEKQDRIARENHERELKRQAEKVGGVTASPEWVKQLFLGYMSLNLRMYEEGEQILFRERLAWAEGGTLNLTLRVNIAQPKALTIRLDENVLDKLEQANISVITLLAKDGTPVMQYKVSDLRGAYEQYGLSGTDLLVVGGADDDVMKIGGDGVMKPVEAE